MGEMIGSKMVEKHTLELGLKVKQKWCKNGKPNIGNSSGRKAFTAWTFFIDFWLNKASRRQCRTHRQCFNVML